MIILQYNPRQSGKGDCMARMLCYNPLQSGLH